MSEYQYYEFVAIDGPISDQGMRYAESCSSRAEVSRWRWRNSYNYGDFHGSVETLLKYYDAHYYVANWGTARLALVVPNDCVNLDAIQHYLRGNDGHDQTLSVDNSDGRCIIWWQRNDEESWEDWVEGEGVIDHLISVRQELMCGDYRALFLGWLADFHADQWLDQRDSNIIMPVIPAGLDCLTKGLQVLIEQFPVDLDALVVASKLAQNPLLQRIPIATVIDQLPTPAMKALLQRVAEGGGARVMSELNRLTYPPIPKPLGATLSCVDFASQVIAERKARLATEAKIAAAQRQLAATARRQHLDSIMERADSIWAKLHSLMDQKIVSIYDEIAEQLQDLHDAYKQADQNNEFQDRLAKFRIRYARRSAMMRRIKELR